MVDADQEHRLLGVGRDRGHRRDSDPGAPGQPVGGHHIDRRRRLGHAAEEAGAQVGVGLGLHQLSRALNY